MPMFRGIFFCLICFFAGIGITTTAVKVASHFTNSSNPVVSVPFDEGQWGPPAVPYTPWVVIFTDEDPQKILGWTSNVSIDVTILGPDDPIPSFVPDGTVVRPGEVIESPTL